MATLTHTVPDERLCEPMRWSREMSGVRRIERFPVSDLVCDLRASCLLCACHSAVFVVRSNLLYGSSMTDYETALLDKLIVARLVKIFLAYYGTLITTG